MNTKSSGVPGGLKLYHYWRSSCSWRVRWAFAFKGIACEYVPVDILANETEGEEHLKRSPLGLVPVLEFPTKQPFRYLCESTAIIEWAEEAMPTPSLLPGDSYQRARIRELAQMIAADTQPLQNLGAQYYHSDDPEKRKAWARHWTHYGLTAYNQAVAATVGKFSVGDTLSLADICLIPQCYNALRFDISLSEFPHVERIWRAAQETESYRRSEPEQYKPA